MKLQRITLKNFRCHKDLTLEIGKNTEVVRPGGWGKSTIADAIYWMFTDAPMSGEKSYSPKPKKDGADVHGVDSSVEIETDIATFKKVFSEKWSKQRGSAERTFTGNQTEYFINAVPYSKGDFDKWISNIADKEQLQCLMNPAHFCAEKPAGLGWERRREILFGLLGDISDDELYVGDFEKVPELLNGAGIDDMIKMLKAEMKGLNSNIQDIPVRIDEIINQINQIENQIDVEEFTNQSQKLEKEKEAAHRQIAQIRSGNSSQISAQSALDAAQATLNQLRSLHAAGEVKRLEGENKALQDKRAKMTEANEKLFRATQAEKEHVRDISNLKIELAAFQEEIEKKITMHKETKAKQYSPGSIICPTCEQPMPKEKIEAAAAKFNAEKAKKLEEITSDGKALREKVTVLTDKITQLEEQLQTISQNTASLLEIHTAAEAEYDRAVSERSAPSIFEDTPEYAKAAQAVADAKSAMESVDIDEQCQPYYLLIEEASDKQKEITAKIALTESVKYMTDRIEELEKQENALSEQYAQSEKALNLIERFTMHKMELFNNAADKHFKTLRFRMFRQNISNDGIQQCCDVLFNTPTGLVPYASASGSEKIRAHIELVEALQKHWGIELPLVIDEAESIAHSLRPATDLQVLWFAHEQDERLGGF